MAKRPSKYLNLIFLVRKGKVCLAMKKRGFGKGKWNGYGGKVAAGESPIMAAQRELAEESGIKRAQLIERGTLHFYSPGEYWQCHIFVGKRFDGKPQETEEMSPRWFNLDNLPFSKMWEDDPYWLPRVLAGKRIDGYFWFEKDWKKLIKHKVKVKGREGES